MPGLFCEVLRGREPFKTGVLTFLLFLATLPASGQDAAHWLTLGIDFTTFQTRDQLASPLRYKGRGRPLRVRYDALGSRYRVAIDASFHQTGFSGDPLLRSEGNQSTSNTTFTAYAFQAGFSRLLPWPVVNSISFWGGAKIGSTGHFRGYQFFSESREVSWDVVNALSLEGRVVWSMRRGRVDATVAFPLFAYVNRPPDALEGDLLFEALFNRSAFIRLGDWAGWGRLRALAFEVLYSQPFGECFEIGFGYGRQGYRYTMPQRTAGVSSGIRLVVRVRLDGGRP